MSNKSLPIAGHRASLGLALTAGVTSLCLYQQLMGWVLILMLCAVGVRCFLFYGAYRRTLQVRTINLLAVLTCVALAWFSREQGILLTMINLMVSACALKLLLLKQSRDFLQIAGCLLFLVGCTFIFSQALFSSILFSIVLMAALLSLQLFYAPQLPFKGHLKSLLKIALQALPIAIILFISLPHLPPLWGMPEGKNSETGLSEKITPGDIAKLTRSDEKVFTATFDGQLPKVKQRYWRAMVLEQFDGKSWEVSEYRRAQQQLLKLTNSVSYPEPAQNSVAYQLLTEQSANSWLFTLGMTVPADANTRSKVILSDDYTLFSRQHIISKQTFNLKSTLNTPLKISDNDIERKINLTFPDTTNLRTLKWAKQLRLQSSDNQDYAQKLMQNFAQQNFVYTLTPPVMRDSPVDAFLFDYQQGFCAHYASAMALAFRAAGIPARLVSGYQGGELIADRVMNVYQYDAHAWVEASIDGQTWQRFDPTAMVAASRLLYGFQNSLSEQQQDLPFFSRNRAHALPALAHLYKLADTLNYQWNRWVLGFDDATQQDMFTRLLGNTSMERMTLYLLAVVLFIAGLLAFYFVPRPPPKIKSESLRLYHQVQAQIFRVTGIARNNESARVYVDTVSSHLNTSARSALAEFVSAFEKVEYQQPNHPANRQQLRFHYRKLKKALRRHSLH